MADLKIKFFTLCLCAFGPLALKKGDKMYKKAMMVGAAVLMAGCITLEKKAPEKAVMKAKFTMDPVTVDGKLDDPVWKEAQVYKMQLPDDRAGQLQEGGEVMLAWDNDYLYVGVKFEDKDAVAKNKRDQEHHYLFGDLAELFLHPAEKTWYWEMYVTPRGNKTKFFFPGGGHCGLSDLEKADVDLEVEAEVNGTLNKWQDEDKYWTGEMRVPVKDLEKYGDKFGPGKKWDILVARYNYGRHQKGRGPEYSTTPKLPITSFHYLEGYAELLLEK
jgi:hypothetical protein